MIKNYLRETFTSNEAKEFIDNYHVSGKLKEFAAELLSNSLISVVCTEDAEHGVCVREETEEYFGLWCNQNDIDAVIYEEE